MNQNAGPELQHLRPRRHDGTARGGEDTL